MLYLFLSFSLSFNISVSAALGLFTYAKNQENRKSTGNMQVKMIPQIWLAAVHLQEDF